MISCKLIPSLIHSANRVKGKCFWDDVMLKISFFPYQQEDFELILTFIIAAVGWCKGHWN